MQYLIFNLQPSRWEDTVIHAEMAFSAYDCNFSSPETSSHFFRTVTLQQGLNSFVTDLSNSPVNLNQRYQPQLFNDTSEYQSYRDSLEPLASLIKIGNVGNSDDLQLCSLKKHSLSAGVALKRIQTDSFPFTHADTHRKNMYTHCCNVRMGYQRHVNVQIPEL